MTEHTTAKLNNGTVATMGESWCHTVLPNGCEVHAHPDEESPRMARELGYGDDVAALSRSHDWLHSLLCDALGLPYSYSLMLAAGCEVDKRLADLEEAAVLATQRFARAAAPL